jgi:hypothetical protein
VIIYAVVLVETLQILWFSIHPILSFERSEMLLGFVRSVLGYLNFEDRIRNDNGMLFEAVIITTVVVVVHLGSLALSVKYYRVNEDVKSEFVNIVHSFTMIQIVLVNTVLTIPIFNVAAITLYCH